MSFLPGPAATVRLDLSDLVNPPPVVLAVAGPDDFKLLTAMKFQSKTATAPVDVPASGPGSTTDLASVPKPLWGILAPYGHQLRPALLHDHLCDDARAKPTSERFAARRLADNMFREALDVSGVSVLRRNIFWAAVSFGRYLAFRTVIGVFLAIVALASACVFWAAAFVGLFGSAEWLGRPGGRLLFLVWAAIVVVGSALFVRDFKFVFVALIVAPIVAPTALLSVVTLLVLYVLDWLLTVALRGRGRATSSPVVAPTFRWDASN